MSDSRQYRDEPLAFDDRRPPARRGPAPVTLIISILLLLGVAGGVAYLYRDGVRGADGPPRPVGAPLRDVRTVAPPSPQTADPAAGLSIYKDNSDSDAAPKFAPPPEEPVARVAESPPVAAAPLPAPTAQAAPAKAMTIDKLIAQSDQKADPKTAAKTGDTGDEAKPAVKAVVQIGSFSSEALATAAFHDAARLGGGKMSGKAMRLVPIEKGDVTLYRVAATGFTSKEDAQAVCDSLKAAGKACFVR
jgi:cell division protein FtsN